MSLDLRNSPFVILGVSEDATDDEIKHAYRRLALRYHPDRSKEKEAEQKFKRTQLCYQLLKTPQSRDAIKQILQLYRSQGKASSVPLGSRTFAYSGKAYVNQGLGWRFNLRRLWYELKLGLSITFRIEHVPVKMLLFVPAMLVAHSYHNAWDELRLTQALLALIQGFIGAWIADLVTQFVMKHERWYMRTLVDRIYVYWLLGVAFLLISLAWLHGTGVGIGIRESIESVLHFELSVLWDIALIILLCVTAAWFTFCFMFNNKYHPFWEASLICVLIAGIEYLVLF